MNHNISWDNEEKTVVLQAYIDGASKDDLYLLAKKSADMLNSVKHTVHLIVDERNIDLVLNSTDMVYLHKLTPINQGAVVVVIPAHKLKYKTLVQQIGKKLGPNAFAQPYFAETVEDARLFLQEAFEVSYASDGVT